MEAQRLMSAAGNKPSKRKTIVKDVAEIRRLFNQFDTDESGSIEPREFLPLLSTLLKRPKSEMDAREVWQHWDSVDTDGSGSITFDEFSTWYCNTFQVQQTPDFR